MEIVNYKINLKEDCPTELIKPIENYWELDENLKFVNKPGAVAKEYNLKGANLSRFVRKYSSLSVKQSCKKCNKVEDREYKSQSTGKKGISDAQSDSFICDKCFDGKNNTNKRRVYHGIFPEEFERQVMLNVIEEREWEKLDPIEFDVLTNIVKLNDVNKLKSHYSNTLNNSRLFQIIHQLYYCRLINTILNDKGWICKIEFLDELRQELIKPKDNPSEKEVFSFDEKTQELKINLARNSDYVNFEDPKYNGVFRVTEDVILKKGAYFTYGAWEKVNGEFCLSLIPVFNN